MDERKKNAQTTKKRVKLSVCIEDKRFLLCTKMEWERKTEAVNMMVTALMRERRRRESECSRIGAMG